MKVLWVTNIMMPEFAEALGGSPSNYGGWMPSLLAELRGRAKDVELLVMCEGREYCTRVIGGVTYVAVERLRRRFRRDFNARSLRQVEQTVSAFGPQVIHIHGTEYGYAALPAKCWCGVPVVVSFQGVLSGLCDAYLGGLRVETLRRFRNAFEIVFPWRGLKWQAETWTRHAQQYEQQLGTHVAAILGRTEWDRGWARFLAPWARYYHVGEILRNVFYECHGRTDDPRRHVIYASAAAAYPLKCAHVLLGAVRILKRDFPDVELRLADAAGVRATGCRQKLGRSNYKAYLSHLIDRYGIGGNVVLLPALSATEVAQELLSANVFCLASMCENSPNSLAEAQMLRTPAVAVYAGGITSMAAHEESALMVAPNDAVMLAMAVERIFRNGALGVKLAQKAEAVARRRHDRAGVVEDLLRVYHDIGGEASCNE